MSKWNPDDHLPECGITRYPICICDRLRACEQRVLDEARDAVESVDDARGQGDYRQGWMDAWDACLQAMDALKAAP